MVDSERKHDALADEEEYRCSGGARGKGSTGEVKRWLTWNTTSVTEIRRNFKVPRARG